MIIYFSGTGNSRYVANVINSSIDDEMVSMNDLLKTGIRKPLVSEKPFVFVTPTYGWRIPRIASNFIHETDFSGNDKVYFVMTCGDGTGNAAGYARKLCAAKNLIFMGLASVIMPENYIAMFKVPDKAQAEAIIAKAEPGIHSIADYIKNGQQLPSESVTLADRFLSSVVNPIFYRFIVSAKGFYAIDKCVACGKCVRLCPLSNIRLLEGKPQWGKECTHCMACICGCPEEAIEYKNESQGKPRYYLGT